MTLRSRFAALALTPLLGNPHVQTAWTTLVGRRFPRSLPPSEVIRFTMDDGEPLVAEATWRPGRAPAAVLIHGLEGSATAHYMIGTALKLDRAGFHVVRVNQRGCGAGEGSTPTVHHGGRSDDVAAVLGALSRDPRVDGLAVIGFSLGGNIVLKMLGERGSAVPRGLFAAAALSPLVNPAHVQRHLDEPRALVYRAYFLRLMASRLRRRAALFPAHAPDAGSYFAPTVLDFDERYTARLIGFAGAEDYYRRADSLPLLRAIRVPTLLIHAKDDPVVPFSGVLPSHLEGAGAVTCVFPETGGHLGFYDPRAGGDGYWAEDRAVSFVGSRPRA